MDVEAFWPLVDASRAGLDLTDPEAAVDEQLDSLALALTELSDRRLLAFQEAQERSGGGCSARHSSKAARKDSAISFSATSCSRSRSSTIRSLSAIMLNRMARK